MKDNDKYTTIIQTASRLFSEKGFHTTSMQEIADESNVSKGTIYTYFASKDDLLYSIIFYFVEYTEKQLEDAFAEDMSPKDKFIYILIVFLKERSKYKDFFSMVNQEQAFSQKTKQIFIQLHERTFQFLQSILLEQYGEGVRPYLPDAYILFLSIFRGYLRIRNYDEKFVDNERLATFITERVYDLLHSMMKKNVMPIITEDFMRKIQSKFHNKEESIEEILSEMTLKLQSLQISKSKTEELLRSINFLSGEIIKKDPQTFLIKGVLANISEIEELAPYRTKIEKLLGL